MVVGLVRQGRLLGRCGQGERQGDGRPVDAFTVGIAAQQLLHLDDAVLALESMANGEGIVAASLRSSIAEQDPLGRGQRNQVNDATGAGSPSHVAVAVTVDPTCGEPSMTGPSVMRGAVAAHAPPGSASVDPKTASVAASGALQPPSIPT